MSERPESVGRVDNDRPSATLIIVDDHPLFRGAMRQALIGGLNSPGLPGDGSVAILEAGGFQELHDSLNAGTEIDLVLLDLTMPGVSGFSGLLTLRSEHPTLPVVIVSATDDATTIRRAIDLGASGFISKSSSIETIREAISTVLNGDVWQPEDTGLIGSDNTELDELIKRLGKLTPQQTRVLSMIGQGLLNKQIAYELGVSEATVKAHVSAVLQKLNVDSRTQAVIAISKLGADSFAQPEAL